jgi:hypothetical protein
MLTKSNFHPTSEYLLGSVGRMAREVATKAIGRLAFGALMTSGTCGNDSMCEAGVVWYVTK